MTWLSSGFALALGAGFGFVSAHGGFCLSSGLREFARGDTRKVRMLLLALCVQLVVLPPLFAAGILEPTQPEFFPLGAVAGGLLFGASMKWASGCAAGILYKAGAGSVRAAVALVTMALAAAAMEVGPLRGFREGVQGLVAAPIINPFSWLGSASAFALPALGVAGFVWLWRTSDARVVCWSWRRTGIWVGLLAAVAWLLSALAERSFGLAVIPGAVSLVSEIGGQRLSTWDLLLVAGIALGGWLSMTRRNAEPPPIPIAAEITRAALGGAGLGVGGSLAAGCTVGHGVTGLALLAPGSVVAMTAIAAGAAATTFFARSPA